MATATCSVCGYTEGEKINHTYTDATCTKASYCTVCGEQKGNALGHDYKLTSSENDTKYVYNHYTCSRCQDSYTDTVLNINSTTVYNAIMAMQSSYPEGTSWTNSNSYTSQGTYNNSTMIGSGCMAFAYILSDAAFGDLSMTKTTSKDNIRVGDILRINGDSHSVVVLTINGDTITVAEGNYNRSIHWGRTISLSSLDLTYIITRYP